MSQEAREAYPWYQLKYGIAESLVPKLEEYRAKYLEEGMCIPTWLPHEVKESYAETDQESLRAAWITELDRMIVAFRMVLTSNTGAEPAVGYDEEVIQRGLESFARYYLHLWD